MQEAESGDAWAFGMIFDHYHQPIYRYIASRVHRPSDAEDLTQLVFVKALEALPRYEARGIPFGGWLFRLARNAVIDHVRTRHDHAELESAGRPGPTAMPAQTRSRSSARSSTRSAAALATLTDEQREAIELRFFAGLSAREAAEAMGKQEGTVRGLQFRAIAALRRAASDRRARHRTRRRRRERWTDRSMSNDMIDLAAGDVRLRQRLEAYADVRLTPELTATSRMRARVLAHAHRRADLARADAALTIVPDTASRASIERGRRGGRRAAVALIAAAILVGAMVGGAAASSGPGGALYEARLWIEDASLPSDPSARAVAELDRLADRLREAEAAARNGDDAAAAAALGAYERIMIEASKDVLAAGDPVAAAALETGLGRNVEVLEALVGHVPPRAAAAIGGAVARAIARSAGRSTPWVPSIGRARPVAPLATAPQVATKAPTAAARRLAMAAQPAPGRTVSRPRRNRPRWLRSGPRPPGSRQRPSARTRRPSRRRRRGRPPSPLAVHPTDRTETRRPGGYAHGVDAVTSAQMSLDVLGAGPAYTDQPGAAGAAYLLRPTRRRSSSISARGPFRDSPRPSNRARSMRYSSATCIPTISST